MGRLGTMYVRLQQIVPSSDVGFDGVAEHERARECSRGAVVRPESSARRAKFAAWAGTTGSPGILNEFGHRTGFPRRG